MDLREYLFKKRMTAIAFAKSIDYNPTYIRQICQGRYEPSDKLKRIIDKATGGLVTWEKAEQ